MESNKHEAVWNWLAACPLIGDMFFNAGRAEDGNTEIIPSEQTAQEYNDGSTLRWYDVALTRWVSYSTDPNDKANIEDAVDIDDIADWVEQQVEAGNFPDFPDGCTVMDISVMPQQSGWIAAEDPTILKYMLQFRIEYLREKSASTSGGN